MINTAPQQVDFSRNGPARRTIATPVGMRSTNQLDASVVRVMVRKRGTTGRELHGGVKQREMEREIESVVSVKTNPEEALAIGVLSQAAHDLRRYQSATTGIKRELYLDAYSWIVADNLSWPYSFVNVCQLLHKSPEMMRAELLADASLGWLRYWVRTGGRISISLHGSLSRFFRESNSANEPKPDSQIPRGLTYANVH